MNKNNNQIAEIQFTEEGHRYEFGGVPVVSVTQAIKGAGLTSFEFVPEEILIKAADFGQKVHRTTELHDTGTLDEEFLHHTLQSYLDGWKKFIKDFDFEPVEIEQIYYHKLYHYAGRVDRIGFVNGKLSVVDIKSGIKDKTHALQTAAYAELYNQDKKRREQVKNRYSVYLSEGSYKLETYDSPRDLKIFLAALTITKYKGAV